MKLLIPAFAVIAATVNADCVIDCPNGMRATVKIGDCSRGGAHLEYHKELDEEIKKACFLDIDKKKEDGHINEKWQGYFKAIWDHVEAMEKFGCTVQTDSLGVIRFDDATNDACRLQKVCYYMTYRYDDRCCKPSESCAQDDDDDRDMCVDDDNKVVAVDNPTTGDKDWKSENWEEFKEVCDHDLEKNINTLGGSPGIFGGSSIYDAHQHIMLTKLFSISYYEGTWKVGDDFYQEEHHDFESKAGLGHTLNHEDNYVRSNTGLFAFLG